MPVPVTKILILALLGTLPALLGPLSGCARITGPSGVRMQSSSRGTVLAPQVTSAAYTWTDASTADIYVSDIPMQQLSAADSLDELAGSIVHIHMFLRPRPGRTPIETTASTVAVQWVVLARGEVGVYGGGGFMFPAGAPGDDTFGGAIKNGSVRLLAATPGFVDRLGAAEFSAGIRAPQDEAAAALLAHLFEHASSIANQPAQ